MRRGLFDALRPTVRQVREEVDEEIRFHLDERATQLERAGWPPQAAREEALRQFGNVDETRRACAESDARRLSRTARRAYLSEFGRDLREAATQLRARPFFVGAVVGTLAIGIGAATAIFSAADHVLLRPLPYVDADRVITLWETDLLTGDAKKEVAPGNFLEWRRRADTFEAMGIAEPYGLDLTTEGRAESLPTWLVSDGFLQALGVRPVLGRGFVPEEYVDGAEPVVMISTDLWRRRYGGDPTLVGRSIELDGRSTRVVGVLPAWADYPEPVDLWAPKRFREGEAEDRVGGYMFAVARLRRGAAIERAQSEMNAIAASMAGDFPGTNANAGVNLVPLEAQVLGPVRPALLVLLAAVVCLLLIACANVANLFLARGLERSHELAVRSALGAGRARLSRQLLAESLAFALAGGALGVALATIGVPAIVALSPPGLPRLESIALDGRVLAFSVGVTIVTALLIGVLPALRLSAPSPMGALRGGRGATPDRASLRFRGTLVVAEIALALVLLVGSGLLARSFTELLRNELGFRTDRRATIQLFLWDRNPSAEARLSRAAEITGQLEGSPQVTDVALVSALPFHPHQIDARGGLVIEGSSTRGSDPAAMVYTTVVSPNFFDVMEIPLRAGRAFTDLDRPDGPAVAIVNETLARRHFPSEDPIGKRVIIGVMDRPISREIVGVVADVRPRSHDSDPRPELYVPFSQSATGGVTFVAVTRGEADAALSDLRERVWEVDPGQAVYHSATLETLVADTLVERRFTLVLLAVFSAMALILAAIGIYGAISFAATGRLHEIGIRLALGARPEQVRRMVLAHGLKLGLMGVVAGTIGAIVLTRYMGHMLFGVEPTDPVTFGGVSLLMLAITVTGASLPARRAARADPVGVLKSG